MDFRFIVAFVIAIVSCASFQNSGICRVTEIVYLKVPVSHTTFSRDKNISRYKTEEYPGIRTRNPCCKSGLQYYTPCIPYYCSNQCITDTCVSRENCFCYEGYSKDFKKKYHCEPTCSKTCDNGKCSAPETCTCNSGYIKNSENKYQCDPICTNCTNGDCVSPEICICNEGYTNVTGECILATSLHCNNTECSKNCTNDQCKSGATFAVSKVAITSMKILLPTLIAGVLVLFLALFLLKRRNSKRRVLSSSQHSEFVIENELYIPMVN